MDIEPIVKQSPPVIVKQQSAMIAVPKRDFSPIATMRSNRSRNSDKSPSTFSGNSGEWRTSTVKKISMGDNPQSMLLQSKSPSS